MKLKSLNKQSIYGTNPDEKTHAMKKYYNRERERERERGAMVESEWEC